MDVDLKSLPDDASLPKDIVLSLIDQLEVKYQEKIHYLEEQLRLFKSKRQIIPTSSAIAFTAIGLRKIGSQTQLLTAIVTGLIFCGRSFFKSCSDCASGSFSKIYLKYA
jgi:hypothetical protein